MNQQHASPTLTEVITETEHYSIDHEIGRGGTAYCYLARNDDDYWFVLKEFAPRDLRPYLSRQADNGSLELTERWLQAEYEIQKRYFIDEVERCIEINGSDGTAKNNAPYILRSHRVAGRDDLLRIDTEQGCTIYDYVNKHRPKEKVTPDYIALCLEIVGKLMEGLGYIHQTHLHLDITPKNIYIVTPKGSPEAGDNNYSVKLFDFASARRKDEFAPEKIEQLRTQYPCTTYTEGYTHYSLRDFWTELEYDPAAARVHAAERPIDERMDLFSVGAVLLYMLTGNQQTVIDGNIDAIQYIDIESLQNNTLLPLLQELVTGAMLRSNRYMKASSCDECFAKDLRDTQRAFQNEAGFSAIQVRAACGRKTFADSPKEELMGQLRLPDKTAPNLTCYILSQEKGMCLSVTAKEGGAGKTSQMQHLYQTLLHTETDAVPLLIPMGQLSEGDQPLTQYICQQYCGTNKANEPALINLFHDTSRRWYLLLDAMDELNSGINVSQELREFAEKCPRLVMVVTSRYKSFHLPENTIEAEILPLDPAQVAAQFPNASERMLDVLRLPMLFRIATEVQQAEQKHTATEHSVYGAKGLTIGSYRVDSEGELLEAYMRCQITKFYVENSANKVGKALRDTLSQAAWASEEFGRDVILEPESVEIAKKCGFIREDDFSGKVRFTHERWHRFFKAYYVYQLLVRVADTKIDKSIDTAAWELLRNERLPEEISSLLGDLTRDYLRVPTQDADGNWHRPDVDIPSTVDRVLDRLRGKQNVGYWCANMISVMRCARKFDFSMANLNELDLRECNMNAIIFSRNSDMGTISASFRNACIAFDNLYSVPIADCVERVFWRNYVVMLCQQQPIDEGKVYIAVYNVDGWQLCDTFHFEKADYFWSIDLGVHSFSLSIDDSCSTEAICYAMYTQFDAVQFSIDLRGKIKRIKYISPPTFFIQNDRTYLIPFKNKKYAYTYFIDKSEERTYSAYTSASDLDEERRICRTPTEKSHIGVADMITGADYVIDLSHIGPIFNLCITKDSINTYVHIAAVPDTITYILDDDSLQAIPNPDIPFLPQNRYIDRLVVWDYNVYYLLSYMEFSPICSRSHKLLGIGITPKIEVHKTFYSPSQKMIYGISPPHSFVSLKVDLSNENYVNNVNDINAVEIEGIYCMLCESPDGKYQLILCNDNENFSVDILTIETSQRRKILNKASVASGHWTEDSCWIYSEPYYYQLNADLATCSIRQEEPFFSDRGYEWSCSSSEAKQVLSFIFRKVPADTPFLKIWFELLPSYEEYRIHVYPSGSFFMPPSAYLTLSQMDKLFSKLSVEKPTFLQVQGCDMRGITTGEPDHARPSGIILHRMNRLFMRSIRFWKILRYKMDQLFGMAFYIDPDSDMQGIKTERLDRARFLRILRYNGAIVDDE